MTSLSRTVYIVLISQGPIILWNFQFRRVQLSPPPNKKPMSATELKSLINSLIGLVPLSRSSEKNISYMSRIISGKITKQKK